MNSAKLRTVMLHLERKTLDWHYFYAQKQMDFTSYSRSLKEQFGFSSFSYPMAELVSLKQLSSID